MFTLVGRGMFGVLPVVIIAGREFAISMYRSVAGARGVSIPATPLAKAKTLVQQLAVGFALLPLTAISATWTWQTLLWAAVLLSLISGWQYLVRARQHKTPLEVGDAL
jgi:CDP-diacylglycerol--glycerol-3-phosphate 3-phosphatidyltransferase